VQDSVYIGTMVDASGNEYLEVYGVQIKPDEGAREVEVTHRISTHTVGVVNLSRVNIDRTLIVPVGDQ